MATLFPEVKTWFVFRCTCSLNCMSSLNWVNPRVIFSQSAKKDFLASSKVIEEVLVSGFRAADSGSRFWILVFVSKNWIWISIVSGIPDSKCQDPRFYKQNFPGFQNLDSLTLGECKVKRTLVRIICEFAWDQVFNRTATLLSPCALCKYPSLFILNHLPGNQL